MSTSRDDFSMKLDSTARHRMIVEAIAEADKGGFISDEKMTAWVVSLGTNNELPEPEPDIFPSKST